MERESWNIGTVINMMGNGRLVKSKVKECMNGLMGIIMMVAGKKIRLKAQGLRVLVGYFMMGSSIWESSTALGKKQTTKVTQLKRCGKMEKSLKNFK